jgi:hypothetical protein
MLLGHYGLALGAKRVAPRLSLGWLVLAAESADLLWPMLLLTGIESVQINDNRNALLRLTFVRYPITHSLVVEVLFGAALAALFWWRTRDVAAAVTCGLLVPSHWLLDAIVHIPDLPVWPGGPKSRSLALGSAHNWIRADGFPDRHSHLLEDYPRQELRPAISRFGYSLRCWDLVMRARSSVRRQQILDHWPGWRSFRGCLYRGRFGLIVVARSFHQATACWR